MQLIRNGRAGRATPRASPKDPANFPRPPAEVNAGRGAERGSAKRVVCAGQSANNCAARLIV